MEAAKADSELAHPEKFHFNQTDFAELKSAQLTAAYTQVREATDRLCLGLSAEDQNLQSMTCASPIKWHRAHTSWFFETFILKPFLPGYQNAHPEYEFLFNSYYNGIGAQFERQQRGLISRPDAHQVDAYRRHVDQAMQALLERRESEQLPQIASLLVLGLNHEQQHQELMLTDLKHAFSCNPLAPAWTAPPVISAWEVGQNWIEFEPGMTEIGHSGDGFSYDNELPRHRRWLEGFLLARRPVNCAEFAEFIDDGGYRRAELWLADGWDWIRRESISAPLYWRGETGSRRLYTLGGERELDPNEPICHVSFFEADAFATWANARLPTEDEWEHAAARAPSEGHFADRARYHPEIGPPGPSQDLVQMFGDVWEWTRSAYAPYPGFKAAAGPVGEYNGKFMANQMVLRGGSCASASGHLRASYRNFFYPHDRWQFSGIRLARDLPQ